ncbi:hypothetical protein H310_13808 [Aphanomyces invadans]|nr:hypothetical protein H310_13808 [Aphanomyces invadans]ETV91747.1 hypothetical protein H310_13808 [Aphanomyces invadans]|eukprot:XP_008879673.1 hypothetical protein H310_13808 [Aphanomyces invadans]
MASLPNRANRGSRINKLIGEAAEADEAFWSHEVWNDDEDEDYVSEAEEEDIVDSDFDEEEAPDEDIHDGDVERNRRAKTRAPKILHQRPLRSTPRTPTYSCPPAASTPTAPAGPIEPMAVRSSTVQKRFLSQELQQKYTEEARNMHDKVAKVVVRMTQEQLLKEAVLTEVQNTASLNRLERLEEEKRLVDEIMPKAKHTGPMVRYHSALGKPKLITFLHVDDFPAVFKRPKHDTVSR